jgi:hypothetical protein
MGGTGAGSASAAPGGGSGRGPTQRKQEAGFSIFLDRVVDEHGEHHWETRLYHAESGRETTIPGASPDQWIAWVLEQIPAAVLPEAQRPPEGSRGTLTVASVEILDVMVGEAEPTVAEPVHTVEARLIIQLTGVAVVERAIGSEVLRSIASSAGRTHRRKGP